MELMKSTRQFCWRAGLGIALLAFILWRADIAGLSAVLTPAVWPAALLALALLVSSQGLAALRWGLILGQPRPAWAVLFRLYLMGAGAGLFLPTSVGGDAFRAAAAARLTGRPAATISSVLLDRMSGVVALLVYAATGWLAAPTTAERLIGGASWSGPPPLLLLALGALLGAGLIGIIARSRVERVRRIRQEVVDGVRPLLRQPARLAAVLGLALLVQALMLLLWLVLATGLALPIPAETLLVGVPIVSLATLLPLTIAGLGVREGVWLFLLRASGINATAIVSFSLLYFFVTLLAGALGGLVFVRWGVGDRRLGG